MYAGKPEPAPSCKSGSPEPLSSPVPSPTIQVEGGAQSGISEGGRRNSGPCPNSQIHALDFQSLLPTRVLVKTRATPTSLLLRQEPPFWSRTSPYMPWGGQGRGVTGHLHPARGLPDEAKGLSVAPAQPFPAASLRLQLPLHSGVSPCLRALAHPLAHVPGLRAQDRVLPDRLPSASACCPHAPPGTDAKPPVPASILSLAGTQAPEGGTRGPRSSRPLRCPAPERRLAHHSLSVTRCHTEPGPAPSPHAAWGGGLCPVRTWVPVRPIPVGGVSTACATVSRNTAQQPPASLGILSSQDSWRLSCFLPPGSSFHLPSCAQGPEVEGVTQIELCPPTKGMVMP